MHSSQVGGGKLLASCCFLASLDSNCAFHTFQREWTARSARAAHIPTSYPNMSVDRLFSEHDEKGNYARGTSKSGSTLALLKDYESSFLVFENIANI